MQQVRVYSAAVFTANTETRTSDQVSFHFLFRPEPGDIILAIQNEIARLEAEAGRLTDGDDAEAAEESEVARDNYRDRIARLSRLCEVAAVCKGLSLGETGTTINKVCVAGVHVGSINLHRYAAFDRPATP